MIILNFKQAETLLEIFGGEDAEVVVKEFKEGYSGPGLYAYFDGHPEEGASFLGD